MASYCLCYHFNSCHWDSLVTTQANTIALTVQSTFNISPLITGILLAILIAVIIFGGVKRIATVSEFLVPFMAFGYILICLIILAFNISEIPAMFSLIISSAFNLNATFSGLLGLAIAKGVQRGVFSNAAGLGSETFESGAANVSHPAKQGLVQAFSVYLDTLLICTATAFMILITGMYNVTGADGTAIVSSLPNAGPELYTQFAISTVIGSFGKYFMTASLFLFCFTTLITYFYKMDTNLVYLKSTLSIKGNSLDYIAKFGFLFMVVFGSVNSAALIWGLADLGVGLMGWVNMIAIVLLAKTAIKVLKDYEQQKKNGENPIFRPNLLNIKNADYWEELEQTRTVEQQEPENIKREKVPLI